ncbi:hypothetical protein [Pseudomonas knackmussii]|uniref:hypothetical protein n=1 Tax=Pseudomonas knackmussii TaxID=65741 RepID=UPI003F4A1895
MITLKAAMPALLMLSLNAYANGYCDTRQTPQAVETCYQQSLQGLKRAVDKSLARILNSPDYSQATKTQVVNDQQAWERKVQATCQNYVCVESSLQARIGQLNRLAQQKPAATPMDPDTCLDTWVAAYRREEGEEVAVTHDQITEWQGWCSEGKLPKE